MLRGVSPSPGAWGRAGFVADHLRRCRHKQEQKVSAERKANSTANVIAAATFRYHSLKEPFWGKEIASAKKKKKVLAFTKAFLSCLPVAHVISLSWGVLEPSFHLSDQ